MLNYLCFFFSSIKNFFLTFLRMSFVKYISSFDTLFDRMKENNRPRVLRNGNPNILYFPRFAQKHNIQMFFFREGCHTYRFSTSCVIITYVMLFLSSTQKNCRVNTMWQSSHLQHLNRRFRRRKKNYAWSTSAH